MEAALECPLALEQMRSAVIAPCGHTFEKSAIEKWLAKNSSCPICRAHMDAFTALIPNLAVRDLLAVPSDDEVGIECICLGAACQSQVCVAVPPPDPLCGADEPAHVDALDHSRVTHAEVDGTEVDGDALASFREPETQHTRTAFKSFLGTNPFDEIGSAAGTSKPQEVTNPFDQSERDPFAVQFTEEENQIPLDAKSQRVVANRSGGDRLSPTLMVPASSVGFAQEHAYERVEGLPSGMAPCDALGLKLAVTLHNLSVSITIPAARLVIPDTILTWRGVAEVPPIPPQGTHRVVIFVKLKRAGGADGAMSPSSSDAWDSYTVTYRGHSQDFPFDASIFAQPLKVKRPVNIGVDRFNILIFGVAGSGKSSFVNKVATLLDGSVVPNTSLAPSGGGARHVTKRLIAYKIPETYLTLWDTLGFHGNYTDDTLPFIFEGLLPSNWQIGDVPLKSLGVSDPSSASQPSSSAAAGSSRARNGTEFNVKALVDESLPTAHKRRIHSVILMVSIDDLEDLDHCRLVADRFTAFKDFSPILVVNKVDKPFTEMHAAGSKGSYFTWLRPLLHVPPVVSSAVAAAVTVSAGAAASACTWVGATAAKAHAGYKARGWDGVDASIFSHEPMGPTEDSASDVRTNCLVVEDSRPRFSEEPSSSPHFDVVTRREALDSTPFWADDNHPIAKELKRVVSERCFISPNSIFLNANYVEHSRRNTLMDLQALRIMEEALRRAESFESRFGGVGAALPHEAKAVPPLAGSEWRW